MKSSINLKEKMKKIARLSILAAFTVALAFTSCTGSTGSDNDGGTSGGGGTTGGDGTSGGGGSPLVTGEAVIEYSNASAFVPGTTSLTQAANMGIGWNLGNTLDAGQTGSKENKGIGLETYWGMPKTTQAMIKAVQAAGFKTIRIPVSWHNHITEDTNYTIDSAWMARVKTIVDWSIDSGMCVILNVHHDNMAISELANNYGFALSDNEEIKTESKNYLTKVWTQIATTFASYGDNLVFEVLNEPRDIGGKWKGNEWWCNDTEVMNCITEYETTCIEAIRNVSGNENRFLMVPGYAASGSDSSELGAYTMPTEKGKDRLLLSAHAYSPFGFAMYDGSDHTAFTAKDKSDLDDIFSYLNTNYIKKGIGVVMGEASASNKDNLTDRINWASYYFTKAKAVGIPVVLWDNMVTKGSDLSECHGWLNRNTLKWYFPDVIKAMMKTVYSDWDGIKETTDSSSGSGSSDSSSGTTVDSGLLSGPLDLISWSVNQTIAADKFSSATSSSKLVFTTEACSDSSADYISVKMQTEWNDDAIVSAGTAEGATIAGGALTPTSKTAGFSYTPTESEWTSIKSKGLIVYGYGIKITKIVLQ